MAAQTILFLGDSIAEGVGASHLANRFSSLLTQQLQTENDKFVEKNLAISGTTLIQSGFPAILPKAIDEKPDIFVIQHGVNDNAVGNSLSEFLWTYRETVRIIKKNLPQTKIVCMTICPSWDTTSSNEWLIQANVGIQEIAAYERTLQADIHLALQNRSEYFPDTIHPDDAGHRIIANTLLHVIQSGKVMSPNAFNFICSEPGQYRLCRYVFELNGPSTSEYRTAEFYGMGSERFCYRSDYAVQVTTPFHSSPDPFKMYIMDGDKQQNVEAKNLNLGRGCFGLPVCPHKVQVIIEKIKTK
jgi:lysophospholipase L1-like esterase